MKIAIFHNLTSGGAKRTLLEVVKRLVDRHVVDVYTLSCANHEFSDLRQLVNNHHVFPFQAGTLYHSPFGRLNQVVRLLDLFRLDAVERNIARRVDEGGYDIAFAYPCQFENSPSILKHLGTVPGVFFLHEPLRKLYEEMPERPYDQSRTSMRNVLDIVDPFPAFYQAVLRRKDQQNLNSARQVLVNSNFTKENAKNIYGIEAKVNYFGVDAQFFHPNGRAKENFVLSVGSLTPLKGFDFIVRSIGLIPSDERPRLVIASNFSNPPEQAYIQNLANESGVSLELQAGITDQKLVDLYNQAALTVYAPVREPFGLVAIESMACATPLVAVREGGIRETVVHGETGLLTSRDEGEFARAIRELMADPWRAAQMGRNGRNTVLEKWTWEAAADRLEKNFFAAVNS